MKLIVDLARCEGHGVCEEAAPDLLKLDDEGDLVLLYDQDVPLSAGLHQQAERAVRVCPIGALRLESPARSS
ncbi:ferredoxin [Streptomyces sp. NPDC001315]|uniref:ferredoxin n=1 Tax=Streptomyces sp. NPDC001315 TaxID=3364562 RepID=UPI0036C68C72